MKRGSSRVVLGALSATVSVLLGAAWAQGQAAPQAANRPDPSASTVMSEQYFKNVQLLKGIPVDEFMDTMGMFAAATGMNCTDCHVQEAGGNWAKYADDNDLKQKTRMMIIMMNTLNRDLLAAVAWSLVTLVIVAFARLTLFPASKCNTALRRLRHPDDIKQETPGAPSADQVLDKYIAALGGAQRLAGLTSIVGKGTYHAYDDFESFPEDLIRQSPQPTLDGPATLRVW